MMWIMSNLYVRLCGSLIERFCPYRSNMDWSKIQSGTIILNLPLIGRFCHWRWISCPPKVLMVSVLRSHKKNWFKLYVAAQNPLLLWEIETKINIFSCFNMLLQIIFLSSKSKVPWNFTRTNRSNAILQYGDHCKLLYCMHIIMMISIPGLISFSIRAIFYHL